MYKNIRISIGQGMMEAVPTCYEGLRDKSQLLAMTQSKGSTYVGGGHDTTAWNSASPCVILR